MALWRASLISASDKTISEAVGDGVADEDSLHRRRCQLRVSSFGSYRPLLHPLYDDRQPLSPSDAQNGLSSPGAASLPRVEQGVRIGAPVVPIGWPRATAPTVDIDSLGIKP